MTQFLLNAQWNQSACSDVHLTPNPVPWGLITVPSLRVRPPPSVENRTATDRPRKQALACMGNPTSKWQGYDHEVTLASMTEKPRVRRDIVDLQLVVVRRDYDPEPS